jgi:decaprenylphospho-beta-D-erythro-pentofuranosid-2-ulose 2-reductase
MNINSVLILGATSDVGKALASQYHKLGCRIFLAARKPQDVQAYLNDWPNGESIKVIAFDAEDCPNHADWVKTLPELPTVTITVFGYLGEHTKAILDWSEAERIIATNYTGAVSVLNAIANAYEKRGSGVIAGISSVAGERGRQSNYIYGSAKAGFTAYLSGLRNRLFPAGVHVITVKPGFINTRMTAGLKLPKPLTASADQVASKIIRAVQSKRNTIYVLTIWFWVMLIIRNIPEFVFKRLKL